MMLLIPIFLCVVLLRDSIATDIQNVTTTGIKSSPYAYFGAVTVKFRDVWGYVCYYGSKKRWGKREATTACKQLGYTGGWPTRMDEIERSTHNLYNFDCDENLVDLNDCEFDTAMICERSVIAGIQCYNSFDVKLVDGKTPNIGRVQVTYDDVMSDVCYSSEDSSPWIFYNTQVLCRELGYPGAMFDRQSTDDYTLAGSTISGYQCKSDLRDFSLQGCYPDIPFKNSSRSTIEATGHGVTVACAVPGYVGCYDNLELNPEPQTAFESENMTINVCRNHCRWNVYRYAFLSRGDRCECSNAVTGHSVGDAFCNMPCIGDRDQVCGDNSKSSLYDVAQGFCDSPLNGTNGTEKYFFGELFTRNCENEMHRIDQIPIQCVLDKGSGEVIWNSTEVPKCLDISDQSKGGNSGWKIWPIILLFTVLLIVCCGLFVARLRYKKAHTQHDECNNNAGTNHSDAQESTEMKTVAQETAITKMTTDDKSESSTKIPETSNSQNEITKTISGITNVVSDKIGKVYDGFISKIEPKRKENNSITPIENYFGQVPAAYEQNKTKTGEEQSESPTYKNRKFYNQKKTHKSGYTKVSLVDEKNDALNTSGELNTVDDNKKNENGNVDDKKKNEKGKENNDCHVENIDKQIEDDTLRDYVIIPRP